MIKWQIYRRHWYRPQSLWGSPLFQIDISQVKEAWRIAGDVRSVTTHMKQVGNADRRIPSQLLYDPHSMLRLQRLDITVFQAWTEQCIGRDVWSAYPQQETTRKNTGWQIQRLGSSPNCIRRHHLQVFDETQVQEAQCIVREVRIATANKKQVTEVKQDR